MTGTALTAFAVEPSMIFGAHREIDEDIPLRIGDSVDACLLEENAGLLAEGLLPLWQLRDVGCDRSGLTAGNGEVGRILVETKRLAPSAFAGPRDEASDARHLGIVEVADTNLVVRREQIERRADTGKIVGRSHTRRREAERRGGNKYRHNFLQVRTCNRAASRHRRTGNEIEASRRLGVSSAPGRSESNKSCRRSSS